MAGSGVVFKITRKGFYRLSVDSVDVSQHTDPNEAIENGQESLVNKPDAVVNVVPPPIRIEWEAKPSVVTSWTVPVDVSIGPGENVVLSSTTSVGLRITPI